MAICQAQVDLLQRNQLGIFAVHNKITANLRHLKTHESAKANSQIAVRDDRGYVGLFAGYWPTGETVRLFDIDTMALIYKDLVELAKRTVGQREKYGGEGGIRTLEQFDPLHAFQACSFSHSDTSPYNCNLRETNTFPVARWHTPDSG